MSRDGVLAIPGLLCDGFVWDAQVAALESIADVVVADTSGHDDLADMAGAALRLADDAGHPTVHVVGHSMGGRVALEIWRAAPERVRSLVLLDTGVHPAPPDECERRRPMLELAADGMAALADAWLPPMVHPDRRGDEALMTGLRDMVCRSDPARHARQITALVRRPDATPLLGTITVPTLVVVGREDGWSPVAQHEEIARRIPGAVLEVVEDAGHFVTVEQPGAASALLVDWVTSLGGAR